MLKMLRISQNSDFVWECPAGEVQNWGGGTQCLGHGRPTILCVGHLTSYGVSQGRPRKQMFLWVSAQKVLSEDMLAFHPIPKCWALWESQAECAQGK